LFAGHADAALGLAQPSIRQHDLARSGCSMNLEQHGGDIAVLIAAIATARAERVGVRAGVMTGASAMRRFRSTKGGYVLPL
jgi:hypothetical protein